MIGFEVNRGRRGIRRGEVLSFDPETWKAFVTLDGSLSAVELAVGNWVPGAGLGPGAKVAVMLFDENNPADGLIVGAYGLASPSVDGLTWFKPTDTFNRFVDWTWATDGIFDGPPSTVDLTLWPGLVRLANDSITEDHFAYRTVSGNTAIAARLSKGVNSYVGLRLDAGSGSANYEELNLVDGTVGGTFRLQYRGVSGATSYFFDGLTPGFYVLRLVRIAATVLCYLSKDSPVAVFFHLLSVGNWTPTRAGIVFGQRGAVDPLDRAGMVHWLVL